VKNPIAISSQHILLDQLRDAQMANKFAAFIETFSLESSQDQNRIQLLLTNFFYTLINVAIWSVAST
jgi:hypothetical protein